MYLNTTSDELFADHYGMETQVNPQEVRLEIKYFFKKEISREMSSHTLWRERFCRGDKTRQVYNILSKMSRI